MVRRNRRRNRRREEAVPVRFTVPDEPEKPLQEGHLRVPSVAITRKGNKAFNEDIKPNRFTAKHGHEGLALLSFDENVETQVVKTLLRSATINEKAHAFIGCSVDGLKKRKYYIWKGTLEENLQLLYQDGDFESIEPVSKRIKRICLLFSSVKLTNINISPEDIVHADDFIDNGYNFSDGCGGIGTSLAEHVFAEIKERHNNEAYRPSVYQIRLQGYKGVLALDEKIDPNKILIRPSMEKFNTDKYPSIAVCNHSRPYTFGHLNKQFIQLLSGLGISDAAFEGKQVYYFGLIETMFTNSDSAVTLLQWENKFLAAQIIIKAGGIGRLTEQQRRTVIGSLNHLKRALLDRRSLEKMRILIPNSRRLFGICDPTSTLKYGECFLRITDSGQPKTVKGQVVVSKSPCHFLGDLRVLSALDETNNKDVRRLHHLVDCIVFPRCGKRPHSHEIGGGDLDGDEYFVTWDEDLIPEAVRPPYDYPDYQADPNERRNLVTGEEVIDYLSKQNESGLILAKIEKYRDKWAVIRQGIDSPESRRLGELFSRAVDAEKSGEIISDIPENLKPPEDKSGNQPQPVWSRMKSKGMEFETEFKKSKGNDATQAVQPADVTEEMVMELVQRKESNLTAYQKFKFLLDYSRLFWADDEKTVEYIMKNYIDYIEFPLFSVDQKCTAMDVGVPPEIVMNDLNRSSILLHEELEYFRMHTVACPWSWVFVKDQSSFSWCDLVKALTSYDNVLMVIEMSNEAILLLQFQEKLSLGEEQRMKPDSILSMLFSRRYDLKRRYNLGSSYYFDFTDDAPQPAERSKPKGAPRLQLYRSQNKGLTFIWIGQQPKDLKSKKKGRGKIVEGTAVSVNLQRFDGSIFRGERPHPAINKENFVRIELYARKKDKTAPYWDTIEANNLSPVPQIS